MKFFTYSLAMLGALVATSATQASVVFWLNETEMPKSLSMK